MEQVIFAGSHDLLNPSADEAHSIIGDGGSTAWYAEYHLYGCKIVSTSGYIKNLRVKLSGAPGAGKKYTFTLRVNDSPTALTLDIADTATSGSDTVHKVAVSGGDKIDLLCEPTGTPTARYARWTSVFEGDSRYESLIMGGASDVDMTATVYTQVVCTTGIPSITENNHRQVVPTAGTIKNFYVELYADPGTAPDAYRFTLRKNGASQTLTVTITADDKTGNDLVNSFSVVAGDILTIMIEPLNEPAVEPYCFWGMTFVADIDGESIIMGGAMNLLAPVATEYNEFTGSYLYFWSATENEHYSLGQICTLKKLHILLSGSPGTGNKYDFTVRIGAADSNVVTTIADAATTGNSGTLEDTVALDEYVNLKVVPTSIPTERASYWGLVCYVPLTITVLKGISHADIGPVCTRAEWEADDLHELSEGTSFPDFPFETDFFYRTDLHKWHYYNGMDWITMVMI